MPQEGICVLTNKQLQGQTYWPIFALVSLDLAELEGSKMRRTEDTILKLRARSYQRRSQITAS